MKINFALRFNSVSLESWPWDHLQILRNVSDASQRGSQILVIDCSFSWNVQNAWKMSCILSDLTLNPDIMSWLKLVPRGNHGCLFPNLNRLWALEPPCSQAVIFPAILLQGTSNWEDFAFKLKAVATTQILRPEQFKTELQEAHLFLILI